jgi:hypothetical protein
MNRYTLNIIKYYLSLAVFIAFIAVVYNYRHMLDSYVHVLGVFVAAIAIHLILSPRCIGCNRRLKLHRQTFTTIFNAKRHLKYCSRCAIQGVAKGLLSRINPFG